MDNDFLRLVETANPAASGSSRGYPPPPSGSTGRGYAQPGGHMPAMDPFFDDDDYDAPLDSAFSATHSSNQAMQSTESGLPFARAAAPPAGMASSTTLNDDAKVKTWTFDDDDPPLPAAVLPYAGSAAFPGTPTPAERGSKTPPKRKQPWRWPWAKEEELTGERIIALNDPQQNIGFCSNYVSTGKYNLASFVPKFLFGM